jgi:hypothetical protein
VVAVAASSSSAFWDPGNDPGPVAAAAAVEEEQQLEWVDGIQPSRAGNLSAWVAAVVVVAFASACVAADVEATSCEGLPALVVVVAA